MELQNIAILEVTTMVSEPTSPTQVGGVSKIPVLEQRAQ